MISACCLGCLVGQCDAEPVKRPFTVADDIELRTFGDSDQAVQFSPDGAFLAVYVSHGRLDINRPEDTLRLYSTESVRRFLEDPDSEQPPSPRWVLNRSTAREGPIIRYWRWLADSSGIAFLEPSLDGHQHLMLADIRKKTIEQLTLASEAVAAFDIRDRENYVYTAADTTRVDRRQAEQHGPAMVATDRNLFELICPNDPQTFKMFPPTRYLWAVFHGKRFEVKHDGKPVVTATEGLPGQELAISPDGASVVATLRVAQVPSSWEARYPPPFPSDVARIRAGAQSSKPRDFPPRQYVLINLLTGSTQDLTHAPRSQFAGSWEYVSAGPSWSKDGKKILLPGTYIEQKDLKPSRPCVAVTDLPTSAVTCVEMLKGRTANGIEAGFHMIEDASFEDAPGNRVIVVSRSISDSTLATSEYRMTSDDEWQPVAQFRGGPEAGDALKVTVQQGLNEPPLLVATSSLGSRVIWDPNPQLKNVELVHASVYTWKDDLGRSWRGGLFKPNNYQVGKRYPLVIQTHGFDESQFIPSGIYPTAFAARELSAVGIMVLQVDESLCPVHTPDEAPCAVSGYQAAIAQLVSEGLVKSSRVGIIGFSHTCFWVMQMLTTSSVHLSAASITDGVMADYLQYLLYPDNTSTSAINATIGAPPFGEGLKLWLKRSPGFNLEKISTPLSIATQSGIGLLAMLQPYAGLHYLNRSVELTMLNSREHVLTSPAVRMASQGGSVDWFRFWLLDEEDHNPAKAEQYARWRAFRNAQAEFTNKN